MDVTAFERHIQAFQSHGHPDGDPCTSCIDHLSAAVTLANDEFLAGFTLRDSPPFDEWSHFQRERLRANTAEALAALAVAHSQRRDLKPAIAYARRRLALDSLHEPAHRQLMELYAQDGQHSLAMHQYEECVRFLRTELDVDPSTETTTLFEQIRRREFSETTILGQKPASQAQDLMRVETREHTPISLPPNNLLAPLTSLIGRQQDLAGLHTMLVNGNDRESIRLLTLTGPGGVGKTRLSQAVAIDVLPHFVGGVYFVTLASIRRPDLLPSVIAETLGILQTPDRSIMETLIIALSDKRMLLVLDNFEHILAIAPIVTDLLRACPQLTVLATSRETLHLSGEHEFVVRPLTAPEGNDDQSIDSLIHGDAIQLFAQRARQARHDFALDAAGVPIVAQICRQLDGLPLAIELAAARTRHFTLPALLSQLNGVSGKVGHEARALHLLKDAKRDVSERHHSLRTAIAWSYDLLAAEEQALFRRLSVFVGGWTPETAAAICGFGLTIDIWDGLASLLDKHLIIRSGDDSISSRFSMLETLREFGLDHLRHSNEEGPVRARMATYFLVELETLNAGMLGPLFSQASKAMRQEHANIRTVIDWALRQRDENTCLRLCVALHFFWTSFPGEAERILEETLKLIEEPQASIRYATALVSAGYYTFLSGKHEVAYQRFSRGLAIDNRLDESISPFFKGMALGLIGWIRFHRGEYEEAESEYRQAIMDAQVAGDAFALAMAETNLGRQLAQLGRFSEADSLIERALQRHRRIGHAWGIAKTLGDQGELYIFQGQYADAAQSLEEGLDLAEKVQASGLAANAKAYMAMAAVRQAKFGRAAQLLQDTVTTLHAQDSRWKVLETLEITVELAAAMGMPRRALRLASAVASHRKALNIILAPVPGAALKGAISEAHTQLSHEASDGAWDEGSTLSLDNAVALAVEVCDSV